MDRKTLIEFENKFLNWRFEQTAIKISQALNKQAKKVIGEQLNGNN